MFEKFTERARRVMGLARQEAQRLNSEFIGTEHILLGIVKEDGGVAAKVLKKLQLTGEKIQQEVQKLITPATSPTVTLGQLPFSPRAKRVIELAHESSSKMWMDIVGTEHLLIALVQENEGIAAQVICNAGLKLEQVHAAVVEELGDTVHPESNLAVGTQQQGINYLKLHREQLMSQIRAIDTIIQSFK
jgi:ATP-dependent Clp protease ATP-binding subunit ClpC